jgi:thiosulfate dehydrogenase
MKLFHSIALTILAVSLIGVAVVSASPSPGFGVTPGAQLYDKWYAAAGVPAPQGDMPIWSRQSTNTRSGAETWRCAECHGWDYQGREGAYASGSHYTGFPSLLRQSDPLTDVQILAHLKGVNDPQHDFSAYLDDFSLRALASFLKNGLIDDRQYIDPVSLQVIDGDLQNGKKLYTETCSACHGEDGKQIVFRTEGVDEYLGSVAERDPWRFLHRTRFGVAGTPMPAGYDLGWTPADGRDILMYTQTLPTGREPAPVTGAGAGSKAEPLRGGPASNLLTGILTGLAAFFGTFGVSLLFLAGLVILGMVVVSILRGRK